MPPQIALVLTALFIVGILVLDNKRSPARSKALWIPTIWALLVSSKFPSQWLYSSTGNTSQALTAQMEGTPLDRNILLFLIGLAVITLCGRRKDWGDFSRRNVLLVLLFVYWALSIFWSEYPFVSFKRWIKVFAHILMVLIVVTEVDPVEGVRAVLRRTAYVLIPLSILLIKYYPNLGSQYTPWTGFRIFVGAATGKNLLGALCLITGIFIIWDLLTMWRRREEQPLDTALFSVNCLILLMVFWLFKRVNSATSLVCFILGISTMVALGFPGVRQNIKRSVAYFLVVATALVTLEFSFNLSASLLSLLGRDPTLTGRTDLWIDLLAMHENVLFGAGYEGFWLGHRLEKIWAIHWWRPNQAHNGYIETYLQGGVIGVGLLLGALIAAFRRALALVPVHFDFARLSIACLILVAIYNLTEAACRGVHPILLLFILCAIDAPGLSASDSTEATESKESKESELRLPADIGGSMEPVGTRGPEKIPATNRPRRIIRRSQVSERERTKTNG